MRRSAVRSRSAPPAFAAASAWQAISYEGCPAGAWAKAGSLGWQPTQGPGFSRFPWEAAASSGLTACARVVDPFHSHDPPTPTVARPSWGWTCAKTAPAEAWLAPCLAPLGSCGKTSRTLSRRHALGDRRCFGFHCCLGILEQPVATDRDAKALHGISKLCHHADGRSGSRIQRSAGVLEPQ